MAARDQSSRGALAGWLDARQSRGLYWFTPAMVGDELGLSPAAVRVALHRLATRKRVAGVHRGFYVIVPAEFRAAGTIPPDWFIADLMGHLGLPYYVGLLSAATYHGAAHQRPQKYHVVTARPVRELACRGAAVRFFVKKDPRVTPQMQVTGQTGYIAVSTPEATAFDLLRYERGIGGLDRVLTVLQELGEVVSPRELVRVAKADGAVMRGQRLGWLLEKAGFPAKVRGLAGWVQSREPAYARLDPRGPTRGSPRDQRWRLILNCQVEGDLG